MIIAAIEDVPTLAIDWIAHGEVVVITRRDVIVGYYIPKFRTDQAPVEGTAAVSSEDLDSTETVRGRYEKPSPQAPSEDTVEPSGLTVDDPLWDIVGIAHSDGPSDVAANKHRYLAESYAARGR